MNYRKILPAVFATFLFAGCSDIFIPNTNSSIKALVVEGLITDGEGPFTVKLTEAVSYPFDSIVDERSVSDAKLTVRDNENHVYSFTNAGNGIYSLPSTFKAKVGNSYALHIVTSDGNTYESKEETLLPAQTTDSIHTSYNTTEYLNQANVLTQAGGYDVRVDLFKNVSSTNPNPRCRFEPEVVLQYEYQYTETSYSNDIPPKLVIPDYDWDVFAWKTFDLSDNNNITEEKAQSASPAIKGHQLCFLPVGTDIYGLLTYGKPTIIYYFSFRQYTVNDDTYNFYKEANAQLAASGKLFDPISSQLYGNMKCTSDPSKLVLGLFEVSSEVSSAYIIGGTLAYHKVFLKKVPYVDIAPSGYYRYKIYTGTAVRPPTGGEYDVIPYPAWWEHTN